MSIKKMIEKKQDRLNRLARQGSITQTESNKQVLQYAKLTVKILGG